MKIITGIYKFTNKVNKNVYIGQSRNILKRYQQHLYDADKRAYMAIDIAIAKYGIENFDFDLVEECPEEKLDEREIYWIDFYNSYEGKGYNCTPGGKSLSGEVHPRALLTEKDVYEIREEYAKGTPRRFVYEKFKNSGISERGFKKIWDCENWAWIHNDVYTEENKEKHKHNYGHSEDQIGLSSQDRAIKQAEIDAFVKDHQCGMNIHQIAKKYNRDYGVVQKYLANPKEVKVIKYSGRAVKNLNTNQIFNSISAAAKWAGCGATTLTRHLNTDGKAGKVPGTQEPAEWIEVF